LTFPGKQSSIRALPNSTGGLLEQKKTAPRYELLRM